MPYYYRRRRGFSYGRGFRRQVRKVIRRYIAPPEIKHTGVQYEGNFIFSHTAPLFFVNPQLGLGIAENGTLGNEIYMKMITFKIISFMGQFSNPTDQYNEWNIPQGMRWLLIKHVNGMTAAEVEGAFDHIEHQEHMSYGLWDNATAAPDDNTASHFYTMSVQPHYRDLVKIVRQKYQVYVSQAYAGDTPRSNLLQDQTQASTFSIPLWDSTTGAPYLSTLPGTGTSGATLTYNSGVSPAATKLRSFQRPISLTVKFPGKGWKVPIIRGQLTDPGDLGSDFIYSLIGFPQGYNNNLGAHSSVNYKVDSRFYFTDA